MEKWVKQKYKNYQKKKPKKQKGWQTPKFISRGQPYPDGVVKIKNKGIRKK